MTPYTARLTTATIYGGITLALSLMILAYF